VFEARKFTALVLEILKAGCEMYLRKRLIWHKKVKVPEVNVCFD
jgi:hypothetical protein